MPRKSLPTGMLAALLAITTLAPAYGVTFDEVVDAGVVREFGDRVTVDLTDGFWAKAGSDIAVKAGVVHQMSDEHFGRVGRGYDDLSQPTTVTEAAGVVGSGSVDVSIGMGVDLPNSPEFYAIEGIQILEKTDDPCMVRLYGRIVDGSYALFQDRRLVAEYSLDKCKNPGDGRFIGFEPSERHNTDGWLDPLGPWYLESVQVCNGSGDLFGAMSTGAGWKIKGFKMKPGDVQGGSNEVARVDAIHSHRPRVNCPGHQSAGGPHGLTQSGWSDWKACGEGQLATGLTMHHWKKKWFTGITLKCQHVRLLPGPSVFKKDAMGY